MDYTNTVSRPPIVQSPSMLGQSFYPQQQMYQQQPQVFGQQYYIQTQYGLQPVSTFVLQMPQSFTRPSAPPNQFYQNPYSFNQPPSYQAYYHQAQISQMQMPTGFAATMPAPYASTPIRIQEIESTSLPPDSQHSPGTLLAAGLTGLQTADSQGSFHKSTHIDEESKLPIKQAAIEMHLRNFERSSSPPNFIQTPMEETLTIGEMSTTQSTRRQLRKPPTVWKLSLFETGQDQIIEVPEGQARIYIIGDADAWSAVGMLYHPKIAAPEASGAPPLMQFGVQGIPAPKEKGLMLYNIGDIIDVTTYKPIKLTVETCPEQTSDEDPKRWIMETTPYKFKLRNQLKRLAQSSEK